MFSHEFVQQMGKDLIRRETEYFGGSDRTHMTFVHLRLVLTHCSK